jgi:nicotinamide mononucleotide transporter
MSPLETTAVGLALAYIALAMRQSRLCWVAAIISAAIYIAIFTEVKLYMEAGLQLVYIGMAIVGWIFWGKDDSDEALAVTTRPLHFHLITIAGISITAACTGFLLSRWQRLSAPGWSHEKFWKTGSTGSLSTAYRCGSSWIAA